MLDLLLATVQQPILNMKQVVETGLREKNSNGVGAVVGRTGAAGFTIVGDNVSLEVGGNTNVDNFYF